MAKQKHTERKEKCRSAKNKKAKRSRTQGARAKVQHQPNDHRVSLKATRSRKKKSLKNGAGAPLPRYERVMEELKRTGSIGELLERLGAGIKGLGVGYRKNLRQEVSKIYALGQIAARDPQEWKALSEDPVWEKYDLRPTDADQPDAFRFAMLRAFGHTRPGRQKASKYYCALKGFFAEAIPANDLPALIKKARGLGALARANAEGDKKLAPQEGSGPSGGKPAKKPAPAAKPNAGEPKPEPQTSVVLHATLANAACELLKMSLPCRTRLVVDIKKRRGNEFYAVITKVTSLPKDGRPLL